jgi:hypothetical protein
MVMDEQQKKITLYIAKNQIQKGYKSFASPNELEAFAGEDEEFVTGSVHWFNNLSNKNAHRADFDSNSENFKTMCKFNESRLMYYTKKISESNSGALEWAVSFNLNQSQEGWKVTKCLIDQRTLY